jgi:nucleoside phosphorylase
LELGARYGSAAVDMETFEALSVCARLNLPAAALRVISDEAARDIPDFNRVYEADGRMNGWRIAKTMIARPVAALGFSLSVRRALGSLKENLRAVLNA